MLQGSKHWLRVSAFEEHSMPSRALADRLKWLEQDEVVELGTKLFPSGAGGLAIERHKDVLQRTKQYFLVRGARRVLR